MVQDCRENRRNPLFLPTIIKLGNQLKVRRSELLVAYADSCFIRWDEKFSYLLREEKMSELFDGRDWEFVEELVTPVLDYHVYGQKCPDCGTIFTIGFGSHKGKFCPMCGRYRERSENAEIR